MSKWIWRCLVMAMVVIGASGTAHATYKLKYNKWTRHAESFNIETARAHIIWYATYFSDDYIKARAKKSVKIGIEPYQPIGNEFVIQMYTPADSSLFTLSEGTFWKVWVTTKDGERIDPVMIQPLPTTPRERILYPKVDRWSKLYLVRFPDVDLGKDWSLTMKSVIAESTLNW